MPTSTQLQPTQFDSLRLELRRGAIPLAVLATLRKEYYGYTLRQQLASLGLEIDESTTLPAAAPA